MTKKEFTAILDTAYEKASRDYKNADYNSKKEHTTMICMSIFGYLREAARELPDDTCVLFLSTSSLGRLSLPATAIRFFVLRWQRARHSCNNKETRTH